MSIFLICTILFGMIMLAGLILGIIGLAKRKRALALVGLISFGGGLLLIAVFFAVLYFFIARMPGG